MPRPSLALPLALVVAPLLLSSCGEDCDPSTQPSVKIEVLDPDGNPVAPAAILFTVDGGEQREARCADVSVTPSMCTTFQAGTEEPGHFVIDASLCGGVDKVIVDVAEGECHVDTQEVTMTLDPSVCAPE